MTENGSRLKLVQQALERLAEAGKPFAVALAEALDRDPTTAPLRARLEAWFALGGTLQKAVERGEIGRAAMRDKLLPLWREIARDDAAEAIARVAASLDLPPPLVPDDLVPLLSEGFGTRPWAMTGDRLGANGFWPWPDPDTGEWIIVGKAGARRWFDPRWLRDFLDGADEPPGLPPPATTCFSAPFGITETFEQTLALGFPLFGGAFPATGETVANAGSGFLAGGGEQRMMVGYDVFVPPGSATASARAELSFSFSLEALSGGLGSAAAEGRLLLWLRPDGGSWATTGQPLGVLLAQPFQGSRARGEDSATLQLAAVSLPPGTGSVRVVAGSYALAVANGFGIARAEISARVERLCIMFG